MFGIKVTAPDIVPNYEGILTNWCRQSAEKIRQRMREHLAEPKSGRIYTIKGRQHQASAPGEAPANLSTALSDFLTIKSNTQEAQLYSTFGYAAVLEEGSGHIAPRPLWQSTFDEMMPTLEADLTAMASDRIQS